MRQKLERQKKTDFPVGDEACKAIFWPTPGFKKKKESVIALGSQQKVPYFRVQCIPHHRNGRRKENGLYASDCPLDYRHHARHALVVLA